jgi:hypothetical protein
LPRRGHRDCKKYGSEQSGDFINGVLDGILRHHWSKAEQPKKDRGDRYEGDKIWMDGKYIDWMQQLSMYVHTYPPLWDGCIRGHTPVTNVVMAGAQYSDSMNI